MPGPRISVLMVARDCETEVGFAIESVLAQTFSDWELVVFDDASTDRTLAIATEWAARNPRIHIHTSGVRLGEYPARNRIREFATGTFLKYHDPFDLLYPHCLEVMLTGLEGETRANLGLTSPWVWEGGPCPMLLTPQLSYQREFLGFGMFNRASTNALLRASGFQGFPTAGPQSDFLFWLDLCARENVLLLPGDLFWSASQSGEYPYGLPGGRDGNAVLAEVWRRLNSPNCPLTQFEQEQAKRNWTYRVLKKLWAELRAKRFADAFYRIRHCGLSWLDWVRYLRRPSWSGFAGVPLDARGDYLIPLWSGAKRS